MNSLKSRERRYPKTEHGSLQTCGWDSSLLISAHCSSLYATPPSTTPSSANCTASSQQLLRMKEFLNIWQNEEELSVPGSPSGLRQLSGAFQAVAVWREKPLKLTGTRSSSYLNVAKRIQFCRFSFPGESGIKTNMKGDCLIPPGVTTRRPLTREGGIFLIMVMIKPSPAAAKPIHLRGPYLVFHYTEPEFLPKIIIRTSHGHSGHRP